MSGMALPGSMVAAQTLQPAPVRGTDVAVWSSHDQTAHRVARRGRPCRTLVVPGRAPEMNSTTIASGAGRSVQLFIHVMNDTTEPRNSAPLSCRSGIRAPGRPDRRDHRPHGRFPPTGAKRNRAGSKRNAPLDAQFVRRVNTLGATPPRLPPRPPPRPPTRPTPTRPDRPRPGPTPTDPDPARPGRQSGKRTRRPRAQVPATRTAAVSGEPERPEPPDQRRDGYNRPNSR
jgi:hypothetical protein